MPRDLPNDSNSARTTGKFINLFRCATLRPLRLACTLWAFGQAACWIWICYAMFVMSSQILALRFMIRLPWWIICWAGTWACTGLLILNWSAACGWRRRFPAAKYKQLMAVIIWRHYCTCSSCCSGCCCFYNSILLEVINTHISPRKSQCNFNVHHDLGHLFHAVRSLVKWRYTYTQMPISDDSWGGISIKTCVLS